MRAIVIGSLALAACASPPSSVRSASRRSPPAADAGADDSTRAAPKEADCAAERKGMLPESGTCPDFAWSPSAARAGTNPIIIAPIIGEVSWSAREKYGDVEPKMQSALPRFIACYRTTKQRPVEGLVSVWFSTTEAGVVEKAFATNATTIPDPAVVECAVREIRGIQFSGVVRGEYSFEFQSLKRF